MYVGVDYYPEHWPQSRWETDAGLMRKAGFNVVRLAEFAWANMEPEEGRFDFAWLDEAVGILGRNGIAVILGTPTAVMPAWVARKYPETLAQLKDGTRAVWGVRKNNCFSSGTYRLFSERITRAMAEHFGAQRHIIGWQTDNEFGHPECYCASCRASFQDWLRDKYTTLEALNRAWGTHFWGHKYGTWGEVQIPVDRGTHNPSACLDWQRFFSWLNVRFQRDQVQILRAVSPGKFVTHNFMGLFSELNYYELAEDLDHVSWDNYPVWGKPEVRYGASFAADVTRGLKKQNFWIMEQTAGPGGWGAFGRNARPGEIRSVAFQQAAHGADGQLWFRWRTCTAGREQYWHGLLGHDGKPGRRYREAAATARELHQLARVLSGTTVRPQVAMVYDYDSIWALRIQPGYARNNYHEVAQRYYNAFFRAGVNVDIVQPTDSFAGYRVVVAPDLYLLPDAVAQALTAFVRAGGVLLTDCRTGVKDATNLCIERTLPGLLGAPLGIEIPEYEALADGMEYPVVGTAGCAGNYTGLYYADWVVPKQADVLAGYAPWHMRRYAAVTRNRFGKGAGYYVGTVIKEESFYDALIASVLKDARVKPPLTPPAGVEVSVRQGRGRKLVFIINHTEELKDVPVPAGKVELLTGKRTGPLLQLGRHGVAVVRV